MSSSFLAAAARRATDAGASAPASGAGTSASHRPCLLEDVILTSDELFCALLEQLAIADAALLCGTSRYARTLSSWAAHYGSPEWRQKNGITKSACAPRDGSEEWSWERLQLCVL